MYFVTCSALFVHDVFHVVLLPGLVAMSKDVESLYASVKALSCVIKTSKTGEASVCFKASR